MRRCGTVVALERRLLTIGLEPRLFMSQEHKSPPCTTPSFAFLSRCRSSSFSENRVQNSKLIPLFQKFPNFQHDTCRRPATNSQPMKNCNYRRQTNRQLLSGNAPIAQNVKQQTANATSNHITGGGPVRCTLSDHGEGTKPGPPRHPWPKRQVS